MWMYLYLVAALLFAVATWFVSPHFQSSDPPSDVTRAFWSLAAGVLWPLVVVGTAEICAVRVVGRRLRPTHSDALDLPPLAAVGAVSLRH